MPYPRMPVVLLLTGVALWMGGFSLFAGDMLVSSFFGNNVLRYDAQTGQIVKIFASGGLSGPHSLEYGPDGNLYVASFSGSRVTRFDGETGELMGTFVGVGSGGLSSAADATFGPDGNLYVSSHNTNSVLKYDGNTGDFIGVFVAPGSGGIDGTEMLVFGPDGNLYIASGDTSAVLRYQGDTGEFIDVFVASGSGGLNSPHDLAFGPDGNLYVTSFGNQRVLRYDGETGKFLTAVAIGGGLVQPHGLAFDNDNNLYVATFGNSTVVRFDLDKGTSEIFVSAGSGGVSAATFLVFMPDPPSPPQFLRGDVDANEQFTLLDAIQALEFLFQGNRVPCLLAVDANDDELLSLPDPLHILNALFVMVPVVAATLFMTFSRIGGEPENFIQGLFLFASGGLLLALIIVGGNIAKSVGPMVARPGSEDANNQSAGTRNVSGNPNIG